MARSTPYREDEILAIVVADLETWAAANQGQVSPAGDELEVLERLQSAPGGLYLVAHWAGDEEFAGNINKPLARHRLQVSVSQSAGLTVARNQRLYTASGAKPALLQRVNEVKLRLLELRWPANLTRRFFTYVDTRPVVTPEGWPLKAYRITVELDAELPAIVYRDVDA